MIEKFPALNYFFQTEIVKQIIRSSFDVAPIILVVLVFQLAIIQQPLPNFTGLLVGTILVILGLAFFMLGLEKGLFPIGENLAYEFTQKGSIFWLIAFAFALGFGTTVAEPALIAVLNEASEVAAEAGLIGSDAGEKASFALLLRFTVAISVGAAIVLGSIRIVKGWPLQWFILVGYLMIVGLTMLAPSEMIGLAYDLGGVTTSTITVPLVTALGIGLSSSIKGRNPMIDGFGLIAFASLTPIIFVLLLSVFL